MSYPVTWQIANETPLRRWFEARLPHLDNVRVPSLRRLPAIVPRSRPDPLPPWLIGMAFDWRLRIGLEVPDDPLATTAHAGWCQVRDFVSEPAQFTDAVFASDRGIEQHGPIGRLFAAAG